MLTLTLSTLGLWACCSPSTRSLIWAARRNVAGQALVPLLVAKREGILDLDRYNAVETIEVLDDHAAVVRAGYAVPAE